MAYPFSLSSATRVAICPSSVALPQVSEIESEDGDRGSALHLYAKRCLTGWSRLDAIAAIPRPEWRVTAAGWHPEETVRGMRHVRAEVSYALHAPTGAVRELGVDINRNYIVSDEEIPGSNDVEGETFSGRQFVGDWKTGFHAVEPADSNLQLAGLCYDRAKVTEADEVEGAILYVDVAGRVAADRHVFSRFELDAYGDLMEATYAATLVAKDHARRGLPMAVTAGDHCRYCPAMTSCPAHIGLARALVPEMEALAGPVMNAEEIATRIALMTPAEQSRAWEKLTIAKHLVEHIGDGLKAVARQRPIALPNYQEVRELHYEVQDFSREAALELLRSKGATPDEIAKLFVPSPRSQVRALKAPGAPKAAAKPRAKKAG